MVKVNKDADKPAISKKADYLFKPGQSGNPSGRPKIPEQVKEMFKAATPTAADMLIKTINDLEAKPELRIECAKYVIDRVYGKATQPMEIDAAKSLFNVNIQVIEQNDKEPAITIDV